MGDDVTAQRYFRTDAATYEAARLRIDAALGFPSAVAQTCIAPAASAPRSAAAVLVAVRADLCAVPAVGVVLASLLSSGVVQEIDRADYDAAIPRR